MSSVFRLGFVLAVTCHGASAVTPVVLEGVTPGDDTPAPDDNVSAIGDDVPVSGDHASVPSDDVPVPADDTPAVGAMTWLPPGDCPHCHVACPGFAHV